MSPITYIPHEDPVTRWPAFDAPPLTIPRTRAEVYATFGDPGHGLAVADPSWGRANIVERRDMPGVPPRFYFQCHRLAEARVREAFRRCTVVCPEYRIERAGCFNFRHIRHDPKRALSLHSFGIAVDINADDNAGRQFKSRDDVPDFFSPEWSAIWPHGVPRAFVDAWLSVGFVWGGDWDRDWQADDQTYVDPMHFQLALCG